jgi:hypothetical protein
MYGGLVAFPWTQAVDVLRGFRDLTRTLRDETMAIAALLHAPDGSGTKIAALALGHMGSAIEGEAIAKPFRQLGTPIMDMIGPIPYIGLNSMLDASYTPGLLNYWKSHFLPQLSDGAIRTVTERFEQVPSQQTHVVLEHFHGAASRVPVADTAFALRSEGYNMLFLGQWTDKADDDTNIAWVRQSYAAMQPFLGPQRYLNYLGGDEPADAAAVAYGPNYPRLQALKAKYDPDNLFHLNQNIKAKVG